MTLRQLLRRPQRRPPTLRGRVSGLALVVIAAWLVVLAGGFDLVLAARLDRQVNDSLHVRAQAASATVQTSGDRVVGVRDSATDSALDSSIWVFAAGRPIEQAKVPARVRTAADALSGHSKGYAERAGHRFYVLPIQLSGHRAGSIVAATDLDPYNRTKDTAVLGSALVAVLLLAGAYPVLRIAAGRALRPVARMTRQAAEWSVNAPGQRFGVEQRYGELQTLAGTLDELLDRLAAVLRHERHLSAELSHELRTPLARVAAQVDLVVDTARPDQRPELLAIRENCTLMDGIIDSLLAAARRELVGTVGRCELQQVFADIAAEDPEPPTAYRPTDLAVGVEHDLLVRILSPVVENARRFAATNVQLAARRVRTDIGIEISNDGPRLDPALAEQVFAPGFRGDLGDEHGGAGLGLALARRLARSVDGDLTVDPTADRTTFRVTLPAG